MGAGVVPGDGVRVCRAGAVGRAVVRVGVRGVPAVAAGRAGPPPDACVAPGGGAGAVGPLMPGRGAGGAAPAPGAATAPIPPMGSGAVGSAEGPVRPGAADPGDAVVAVPAGPPTGPPPGRVPGPVSARGAASAARGPSACGEVCALCGVRRTRESAPAARARPPAMSSTRRGRGLRSGPGRAGGGTAPRRRRPRRLCRLGRPAAPYRPCPSSSPHPPRTPRAPVAPGATHVMRCRGRFRGGWAGCHPNGWPGRRESVRGAPGRPFRRARGG